MSAGCEDYGDILTKIIDRAGAAALTVAAKDDCNGGCFFRTNCFAPPPRQILAKLFRDTLGLGPLSALHFSLRQ